tara:strand:- start:1865 stop:2212 length:348 start_codon:yes stop_codon:yes gene_type:complete
MTKKEIVDTVCDRTTLKKKEASAALDAMISTITTSLACGERVEIRGFCCLSVRERSSRIGRNPKSGQKVQVPPKKVPYFRAAKELKKIVDHEKNESIDLANMNNQNLNVISLRSV